MPIQPSYPGVYIQEVSSGVRTITGVSTSIAAFFGRTQKGPIDKAVRCLSYSDFLRTFGGAHKSSDLGPSLNQFFGNGGTDCYVIRLAEGAQKANITLRTLTGTNMLRISARDAGNWGNNLRLEIDYNTTSPDETFNMRVIHEDGGNVIAQESFSNLNMDPDSPRNVATFVNGSSSLVGVEVIGNVLSAAREGFSESRRPIAADSVAAICGALNALIYTPPTGPTDFEISVDNGPFTNVSLKKNIASLVPASFADVPAVLTALTNEINGQLLPGEAITIQLPFIDAPANTLGLLRIVSATAAAQRVSVKIRPAQSRDLAGPLMLGVDQGGIESSKFANHRPVPNGTFITAMSGAANGSTAGINTFAMQRQDAFSLLNIVGAPPPDNVVNLAASGPSVLITTAAAQQLYRDALAATVSGNNDGVREKLRILAKAINETPGVPVRAEVWGYHLAILPANGVFNSSFDITTSGGVGNVNIGTGGLGLLTLNTRQYGLGSTGTSPSQVFPGVAGRDDDGNPATPDITVANYTGSELDHTGFYALDKIDLFNLMVLPGDRDITESQYNQISKAASAYCEKRRAFLILDAPDDWTKDGNLNQDELKYNEIRNGIVKTHSAIYYPRIKFSEAGTIKYIGPSGMVAGVMARTDAQRGVWKAPAGIEADLRGALDLEVSLTDLENGVLNKQGVNCIRMFPNGIVSWGARTLDGSDDFGSEWKYIPIRRLALFIEESLFRGTKWVVFEPNDEPLWAKIRMNINAFMLSLFRQGAFQGSTPDKAFFVKCDGETTTANDRNLGIVNIQVGFAPLKPAEFVIITIQQIPDV